MNPQPAATSQRLRAADQEPVSPRLPPPRGAPAAPAVPASFAAATLRVALGIVILPHGLQKVFGAFGGSGFGATIEHFRMQWGVPSLLTVLVMAAELLGSLGLLLGLFTRLCAAGIGAVMLGAILMVHWDHGFFMNWSGQKAGEGFEYHLLALGMAVALIAAGGGRWSVDRLIWRRLKTPRQGD